MRSLPLSFLFLSLFIYVTCAQLTLTPAQYTQVFDSWAAAYGKSYASAAESDAAFANFKTNLDTSMSSNANLAEGSAFKPTTMEYGLHAYSDQSAADFVGVRAKAWAPEVAAGAVLSTGAIIGIAVGGAALVAVGATAGAVVYKKRKGSSASNSKEHEMSEKAPDGGVDLMSPKNRIQSITARAPPIDTN